MDFASESALSRSPRFSTGSPSDFARTSDHTRKQSPIIIVLVDNCSVFFLYHIVAHSYLGFKFDIVQQALKLYSVTSLWRVKKMNVSSKKILYFIIN